MQPVSLVIYKHKTMQPVHTCFGRLATKKDVVLGCELALTEVQTKGRGL
jgi:hypothetical protein